VLGLCRILLRQPEEAEDAVQQTFLSAYRSLLNGVEPRHPAAWLATIARNECRARIEQRMREPLLDPEAEPASPLPDPVAAAAARADLGSLWLAIAKLPRRQRKALLLREFSGLSYGELAVALGVSEPTVESLLFRARRDLRRRVRPAASFAVAPLTAIREALMGWGASKVASGVAVVAVAGGTVAAVESGPVRPVVPVADAATRPEPTPPTVAAARPLVPRPQPTRPAAIHPRRVVRVKRVVVATVPPPRPAPAAAIPVRAVAVPLLLPRPVDPPIAPVAEEPEPPPVPAEKTAAPRAPTPEPSVPAGEPATTQEEEAPLPEPVIPEDDSGAESTESSNEGPGGSGSDDGGSSPNEGHGSESSGSGHDGAGDVVDHSGHGSRVDGGGSGGGRGPG
jgi:RNA polymerase sigma factor (sigma-70 family)